MTMHASEAVLAGLAEHAAGVDLDAVDGRDDDDGRLDRIQRFEAAPTKSG